MTTLSQALREPPQLTQSERDTCFEMMDAYRGPEAERVHWLANQFTSYSETVTPEHEADAAYIIALWREARVETAQRHVKVLMGEHA